MSGPLKCSCAVLSARWAMVTGSSGFPSTSSRSFVKTYLHTLPSNFFPSRLFPLVVLHNNHHDSMEGMKRKQCFNFRDDVPCWIFSLKPFVMSSI
uniref:Uncharacterized protein n=1 Tax=Leersia perrieri TaxID=77586 RepID=A0A0D9V0H4_9ORYZ